MLVIGLLWCGMWSLLQGETQDPEYGPAWRPPDKGWFAGWIVYWALTAAVLVFLWWKRARWGVIVITPIASTVITIALLWSGLGPAPFPDQDDYTATFVDGFWRMFSWAVIAAAIASVIGLVALRIEGRELEAGGLN